MCRRYTLTAPAGLAARFGIEGLDEPGLPPVRPRFNIAPGQAVGVVVEVDGARHLAAMLWCFRPVWLTDPKTPPPINARAEGLTDRGMWRGALRRTRCLIPADGFYGWGRAPDADRPVPYLIRRVDGGLFGFAGLYSHGSDDRPPGCAIVTTAPNRLVARLEGRMPAILAPEDEARWLDPDRLDPAALRPLLRPYPDGWLTAHRVGGRVDSPEHDDPDLVRPLAAPPVERP